MIEVKKATGESEFGHIYTIRKKVFIEEQGCPTDLEWENEDECIHFLSTVNGMPAGTARWWKAGDKYKLQRFAVLREFRGLGVGHALVKAVLNDLPTDANYVYLHAQVQACSLYSKFGFIKEGPEFDEAGIRHYKMVLKRNGKSLPNNP